MMLETTLFIGSLLVLVAVSLLGARFVAREDARHTIETEYGEPLGWLPSRRDRALLEEARNSVSEFALHS